MENNKDNDTIIRKITDDMREITKNTEYNFIGNSEWGAYKSAVDDMMFDACIDKTVTSEINKTGFPDEIILRIIENNFGCTCESIRDFSNISIKWNTLPESIGYIFDATLAKTSRYITFKIGLEGDPIICE